MSENYRDDILSLSFHDKYQAICNYFNEISFEFSAHTYEALLCLTNMDAKYGILIIDVLDAILNDYHLFYRKGENKDPYFFAFHYKAIALYHQKQIDSLKRHLKEYWSDFIDYPLFYDALSRYFTSSGDFIYHILTIKQYFEIIEKRFPEKKIITKSGNLLEPETIGQKCGYTSSVVNLMEYCFLRNDFVIEDNAISKSQTLVTNEELIEALDNDKLKFKISDIDKDDYKKAKTYIGDCIDYNNDYPRYYYLKAKYLFYYEILQNSKLSFDTKNKTLENIDLAISKLNTKNLNYDILRQEYNRFKQIVKEFPINEKKWYDVHQFRYRKEKDNIIRSTQNKGFIKPRNNENLDQDYIFISYSSQDYKPVYCDLLEMHLRGIQYVYDVDMSSSKGKDSDAKKKWYHIIEEKIKKSKVVICYLSENFITSDACMKEMELIEQYKKPFISVDLSGLNQVNKIISTYIQKTGNSIPSNNLLIATKMFNEDISLVQRGSEPEVVEHLEHLRNKIKEYAPEVIHNVHVKSSTKKGNKLSSKNEDYLLANIPSKLFIVADGITRNKEEYDLGYENAYSVTKLFVESANDYVSNHIPENMDKEIIFDLLTSAAMYANTEIAKYNINNSDKILSIENPGCCFVIGLIFDDVLYYVGGGDCIITLLRKNENILLFKEQTDYVFNKLHLEKNRQLLVKKYINNPKQEHSYCIANGDISFEDMLYPSYIGLERGDVLFLTSDGASDLIKYGKTKDLINMKIDVLLEKACKEETRLKKNNDDKAVIRIKID